MPLKPSNRYQVFVRCLWSNPPTSLEFENEIPVNLGKKPWPSLKITIASENGWWKYMEILLLPVGGPADVLVRTVSIREGNHPCHPCHPAEAVESSEEWNVPRRGRHGEKRNSHRNLKDPWWRRQRQGEPASLMDVDFLMVGVVKGFVQMDHGVFFRLGGCRMQWVLKWSRRWCGCDFFIDLTWPLKSFRDTTVWSWIVVFNNVRFAREITKLPRVFLSWPTSEGLMHGRFQVIYTRRILNELINWFPSHLQVFPRCHWRLGEIEVTWWFWFKSPILILWIYRAPGYNRGKWRFRLGFPNLKG